MEKREFLVVGAGVSGLGFANHAKGALVVEREAEPGGWCRTIVKDGFTWDYSGHFFHFRHPDIEAWLTARMPKDSVCTVDKRARVRTVHGDEVAFPFQTHLHELPKEQLVRCLSDLERAPSIEVTSFKSMLAARFGRAMCDQFLVPYNEKLYATDLDRLDKDAMGRFFPAASRAEILRSLSGEQARNYNDTFTYPKGGAVEYVKALMKDVEVSLNEGVVKIDLDKRVAVTTKREIAYQHLVTSAPLPSTLRATGIPHDVGAFSANQVLVFNLGFDKKGRSDVHWMYFADPSLAFYRVGFYDNIFGGAVSSPSPPRAEPDGGPPPESLPPVGASHDDERMSLYVEIGMRAGAAVDVDVMLERVLADLAREKIIDGHRLVAWHHVVMNPAYVHITERSLAETARTRALLADHGVWSIGRYGAWTYCSIEDNLVEARALARMLTS